MKNDNVKRHNIADNTNKIYYINSNENVGPHAIINFFTKLLFQIFVNIMPEKVIHKCPTTFVHSFLYLQCICHTQACQEIHINGIRIIYSHNKSRHLPCIDGTACSLMIYFHEIVDLTLTPF